MRFLLNLLLLVGIALTLGFGLSWYALTDGRLFGTVSVGPWLAWSDAGSPSPDPYTRAYIARSGGLELGLAEGLQFVALTDSDSQKLSRNCTYRVDGTTPLARFWTLTAVDPTTGALVTRDGGPTNFESERVVRAGDGALELRFGKTLSPGNWLELAGDGPYSLVLTLYDSQGVGGPDDSATTLPAIIREGCA